MFSLRSHTLRGIQSNFKNMHSENTLCPICERCMDTHEHVINCKVMLSILPLKQHIVYEHIAGSDQQQAKFLQVYENYLKLRDELLMKSGEGSSLPGHHNGPVHHQAAPPTGQPRRSNTASISGNHLVVVQENKLILSYVPQNEENSQGQFHMIKIKNITS